MDGHASQKLSQLRQEINFLNGFKSMRLTHEMKDILGPVSTAFPGRQFPLHVLHEFIVPDPRRRAASIGFVSVILSAIHRPGPCIWISGENRLFPPALNSFQIDPGQIIFIRVKNQKERFWVMEEALKCRGITAVMGEIPGMDFQLSRRLQLAIEQSQVTCFAFCNNESRGATASTARWEISPLPSFAIDDLPGIGNPSWKIDLLRLKNGRPASWEIVYRQGRLHPVSEKIEPVWNWEKRTG